jgi:DNA primase
MMASHARPLWQALPDGALKRQLLGELATHIGLGTAELTDLWRLPSAHTRHASGPGAGERPRDDHAHSASLPLQQRPWSETGTQSGGGFKRRNGWPGERSGRFGSNSGGFSSARGPRATPTSRSDLVARTLLGHPPAWSWLTPEDHHLLAAQPEPLGPLFAWLEGQWHEHGPQPWAVLQQALVDQPFAGLATRLVTQALSLAAPAEEGVLAPDESEADPQRDLREMLNRMLIEDLKQRETQAIARATSEPAALQNYRDLQARRLELERLVQPAKV